MRFNVEFLGPMADMFRTSPLVEVRPMGRSVMFRPVADASQAVGSVLRPNVRTDRNVVQVTVPASVASKLQMEAGRFVTETSVVKPKSGAQYVYLKPVTDVAVATVRSYVKRG